MEPSVISNADLPPSLSVPNPSALPFASLVAGVNSSLLNLVNSLPCRVHFISSPFPQTSKMKENKNSSNFLLQNSSFFCLLECLKSFRTCVLLAAHRTLNIERWINANATSAQRRIDDINMIEVRTRTNDPIRVSFSIMSERVDARTSEGTAFVTFE